MKRRYTIDNYNRLIIRDKQKTLVTNGRFGMDKNNQLIYWLNESKHWHRLYALPPRISFQGNWQLNSNYDLELILNDTENQFKGDSLVLKGKIISIDRDTLAFELKSLDRYGQTHIQLLKLGGFWQADKYNRLSFLVKKRTLPDILTLEGIWQLNQNQQIIYNYEKTNLKTKAKYSQTLIFTGFWQINSLNKLTYILEHSQKSRFNFRVQLESPNIYPKEGVIKYRIGIGLKGLIPNKGTVPKIVTLYGTWSFSRKAGLCFEMDYGRGKFKKIEFGIQIYLTKKDAVTFSITNNRKESLGMRITFTHKFLEKYAAETFLRLKALEKEKAIETGLRIPF